MRQVVVKQAVQFRLKRDDAARRAQEHEEYPRNEAK